MTTLVAIWLAVGLLVGGMHAASLWHAARRARSAALGMLRLAAVGAVLCGAAIAGGLLPAAAGWAVGFVTVAGFRLQRSRSK